MKIWSLRLACLAAMSFALTSLALPNGGVYWKAAYGFAGPGYYELLPFYFLVTVGIELFVLARFYRFRDSGAWLWNVVLVHIISYPPAIAAGMVVGALAEIIPLTIEYPLYCAIVAYRVKRGSLAALEKPLSYGPVLGANAMSFTIGLALVMMMSPPEDGRRPKVAAVKSDMRSMATALESYCVDFNDYPVNLKSLTTPVAYLSSLYWDRFAPKGVTFQYARLLNDDGKAGFWLLWSPGPDLMDDIDRATLERFPPPEPEQNGELFDYLTQRLYDPTNGTVSAGDVFRWKEWEDPASTHSGAQNPAATNPVRKEE